MRVFVCPIYNPIYVKMMEITERYYLLLALLNSLLSALQVRDINAFLDSIGVITLILHGKNYTVLRISVVPAFGIFNEDYKKKIAQGKVRHMALLLSVVFCLAYLEFFILVYCETCF